MAQEVPIEDGANRQINPYTPRVSACIAGKQDSCHRHVMAQVRVPEDSGMA